MASDDQPGASRPLDPQELETLAAMRAELVDAFRLSDDVATEVAVDTIFASRPSAPLPRIDKLGVAENWYLGCSGHQKEAVVECVALALLEWRHNQPSVSDTMKKALCGLWVALRLRIILR